MIAITWCTTDIVDSNVSICQIDSVRIFFINHFSLGRVRGRDGSRDSINPPYINLPSPNVQDDVSVCLAIAFYTVLKTTTTYWKCIISIFISLIQESELFPGRSASCVHHPSDGNNSIAGSMASGCGRRTASTATASAVDEEQPEPPASVLTRRRALVPPKIPPYNIDSGEDTEQSADKETSTRSVQQQKNVHKRNTNFLFD